MKRVAVLSGFLALLVGLLTGQGLAADAGSLVLREGSVALTGNAPFTHPVLTTEGKRVALAGPLASEAAKLQGVKLRVLGWQRPAGTASPLPVLQVVAYGLAAEVPRKSPRVILGVLVKQDAGYLLADPAGVRLYALTDQLPPGIEGAVGAKVALTGRVTRGAGAPQGFAARDLQILAPAGAYRL